ncbi:diphosphomevalonate decarboxylase isoform X2 [Pseudophryne corroboree]|uniref:diphosphomevalonate decarboxylase isoform X2 n=1 Tax=Pseudophryne corroboree TaxID=495146 RepID=UPI003081EA39
MRRVTCTAPVNIAVIKYWGKRNEQLILPINSSLSVTLHQEQLKTTTTVAASRDFAEDRIWLNGKEDNINHPRLQSCLREIRRLARKRRSGGVEDGVSRILNDKVHICSVNNFPTAAGLASSAAGYACLVYSLAKLYGVEGELSEIARQGSGSACRSMYGGFVQWLMGDKEDGKDSLAQQVETESHWPELRILILVASAEKKHVGSTAGMQTSVETSPLLKVSQRIISLVHRYNGHYGQTKVAYSFDAGPNAVIFTLESTVNEFVEVVKCCFPPEANGDPYLKGLPVIPAPLSQELLSVSTADVCPGGVRYMIVTQASTVQEQRSVFGIL